MHHMSAVLHVCIHKTWWMRGSAGVKLLQEREAVLSECHVERVRIAEEKARAMESLIDCQKEESKARQRLAELQGRVASAQRQAEELEMNIESKMEEFESSRREMEQDRESLQASLIVALCRRQTMLIGSAAVLFTCS